MNQSDVDRLLGRAQLWLSVFIIAGYLASIAAVFAYRSELTTAQLTLISTLLSTLGTVFVLVANFWFARHRASGAASDGNGNGNGNGVDAPIAPIPVAAAPKVQGASE